MKRLDIFLSKEVQTLQEAQELTAIVVQKLTGQPDVTVRATYEDREIIHPPPTPPT